MSNETTVYNLCVELQQIVGQNVDMCDVEAIDAMTANYLRGIRDCASPGEDMLPITGEDEWREAYNDMRFVTVSSDLMGLCVYLSFLLQFHFFIDFGLCRCFLNVVPERRKRGRSVAWWF